MLLASRRTRLHFLTRVLRVEQDSTLELDGEKVVPPKPFPWYPDNLAWQMNFSRNQLRKVAKLKRIHEFLKVRE